MEKYGLQTIFFGKPAAPATEGLGAAVQTIGSFDGVHLGHRFLLRQVREEADRRAMAAMAVTFSDPPAATLHPAAPLRLLTTLSEKLRLLENCGMDCVAVLPFTPQLAAMTARDFMAQILTSQLGGRALVVGYDHRFGHQSNETFSDYAAYGRQLGIDVVQARELTLGGGLRASSSAIREALADGDVQLAATLLGRPYSVEGTVVRGDGIGRNLGFPTANIALTDARKMLPRHAAYAVRVHLGAEQHLGMLYVGRRPTIGGAMELRVEVHILDFAADIYGQHLRLDFLRFLRPEQPFASPADLQAQLQRDLQAVRRSD